MEPGTIGTIVDVSLKLPELGRKLLALVDEVRGSRIEFMVLRYLQVVQQAIHALGKERQGMLSDASGCILRDPAQLEALATRMRVYLREDNVREPLNRALAGLRACLPDVEHAAQGLVFAKKDKQAAAQDFMYTLRDLEQEVRLLESTFYPEFSGQGLGTLVPVFEFVEQLGRDLRRDQSIGVDTDQLQLQDLVKDALQDPAQTAWMTKTAEIEVLIVKLMRAFAVKEMPSRPSPDARQ